MGDQLEDAIKGILYAIMDHQNDVPDFDDAGNALLPHEMSGIGDDLSEGKGPLHVEVDGDSEDDLEDGLEEAMKALESMPLDELLKGSKDDEDDESAPLDDENDELLSKALRKPRGGKY